MLIRERHIARVKKILILSFLYSFLLTNLSASAIDVSLSKNNLRLNNTATSTTFTVTLDDDIDALTGTGTIPAKLKIKSKGIESSTQTIKIPYVDGVIGNSDEVTLTLTKDVHKSSTARMMIKFSKKYKKKHSVSNFKKNIRLDADAVQLKGKVTIPTGSLSSFRSRTRKKLTRMRDRGVAPLNTENPEGVVVELVQIQPETGEVVGEPVATAMTDAEGDFEMEMPPEADFGTEFVIIVEGDDAGEEMHAPLFSDEVNVNPATEVLFELTQEAINDPETVGLDPEEDISFENFTDTEAEALNEQMEELKPLYEDTLEESITSLKSSYAAFLNNMIGVAADDDTSSEETTLKEVAKGIAGDYNVVFSNTRMTSEERVSVSIELSGGRMSKPDEIGALIVTPEAGFSTEASLFSSNQGGGSGDDSFLVRENDGDDFGDEGDQGNNNGGSDGDDSSSCYEVEAESRVEREVRGGDDLGNFYMTVDGNRVISFAEAAVEESFDNPDGIYTYTSQPSVMNMIPVGENMFLSSSLSTGKNVSPADVIEYEYDVGFGSIIKKSNLKEGDLAGGYGIVGLGYEVNSSSYGASAFEGNLNFNGSAVAFNLDEVHINLTNYSCGSEDGNYAVEIEDSSEEGSAAMTFKGDRVSINIDDEEAGVTSLFTGFARSDREILTLAYASDEGSRGARHGRNVISSAERLIIFGVRKPSSLVSLSGKSYRVLSLNYSFNSAGGRTIESGDVGSLSFTASTVSVTDFTKTVFAKETGSSETIDTSTSVTTVADLAYTLSATGAIAFDIGEEELTGYVSSDRSLIVLKSDEAFGLGMYLAILQD